MPLLVEDFATLWKMVGQFNGDEAQVHAFRERLLVIDAQALSLQAWIDSFPPREQEQEKPE